MNKRLFLTGILFVVFNLSNVLAQIKEDNTLWTINLGFLETQSYETENNMFTYGINTTIERMIDDSQFAVGANLGYAWSEDTYNLSLDAVSLQSYRTIAIYLTGKYYFTPYKNWTPYAGLGVGFQSTAVDFAIRGVLEPGNNETFVGTQSITAMSLGIPLGIIAFVGDDVYLGFNFTPYWVDHSFYKNNWNLVFNLGVGFQLD